MDRKPVQSSNLASVGYDPSSQTLEIEFRSGGVYQYFDVPPRVHDELMTADSKGRFFARNIRGFYRYVRV